MGGNRVSDDSTMRVIHLAVGATTVIVFLATGLYMRAHFPASYESDETIRYLHRANHVYILYSGLLNLAFGTYLATAAKGWRRGLQASGSGLLLLAPVLLIWAFFVEPAVAIPDRPRTTLGTVCALSGTLLHSVGASSRRLANDEQNANGAE